MKQLLSLRVLVSLALLAGWCSQVARGDVVGFSTNPPNDGPSIKTDRGYMAPYFQSIPGTEIRFEMIPVPGGVVEVGSGADQYGEDAEHPTSPITKVQVQPRWVGKYEVSWNEYWQYMALDKSFAQLDQLRQLAIRRERQATSVEPLLKRFEALWQAVRRQPSHVDGVTAPTALYDPSTTYESGEEPNLPAVTMTPYAAKQYTKWLSAITGLEYRLPSEAEWEHAARANGAQAFGAGSAGPISLKNLSEYAWTVENGDYTSHPVGELKPNAWGLHDMLGNAAEWVLDEHRQQNNTSSAPEKLVSWSAAVSWPTRAYPRVAKGGFWDSNPGDCRIATRLPSDDPEWKMSDPNIPLSPWWYTEYPASGIGFRVVRQLTPMDADMKKRVWEIDHADIREEVDARLEEGRGKLEAVHGDLPEAILQLSEPEVRELIE